MMLKLMLHPGQMFLLLLLFSFHIVGLYAFQSKLAERGIASLQKRNTKGDSCSRRMKVDMLIEAADDISIAFASSFSKAINVGLSGATAGAVQVLSLMWLRTALNYQYKNNVNTTEALQTLYKEGGIARLYSGISFAIIQSPLSRFGDTASNSLIFSLLQKSEYGLPTSVITLIASIMAGGFRILLMPIDTLKTTCQVNGREKGLEILKNRIESQGLSALFAGAVAASLATVVGHYPWFLTYNFLSDSLPTPADIMQDVASIPAIAMLKNSADGGIGAYSSSSLPPLSLHDSLEVQLSMVDTRVLSTMRSAFIGLCASCCSDVCSNSLRVLKTTRQSQESDVGLLETAKEIIANDGGMGNLLTRGLQTRLLSNAMQSVLFSVLFKLFQSSSK